MSSTSGSSSSAPDSPPPERWAAFLRRIAVDRLPGSAAVRRVETAVGEELTRLGYRVERQQFETSAARLAAASAAGAGLGWIALALVPLFALAVPAWAVVLTAAAALLLVPLIAVGIAEGHLPSAAPRMPAVNLVAVRGDPRAWLVAHLDSKAQRFSLRGRVLALAVAGAGAVGMAALLVLRLAGPVAWWAVTPIALVALAGAGALSWSAPAPGSPGAVDNATGIVAVLVAAGALVGRRDVGVLITDAEEFGMEGARAWVRTRPPHALFINIDGVDSRGRFHVMRHRGSGARRVADAVTAALRARGAPVRVGRLPPGVLVDGAVLAGAGLQGVTLSRGDWQTLAIVHTAQDGPDRVDVRAALMAGDAAAAALGTLLG